MSIPIIDFEEIEENNKTLTQEQLESLKEGQKLLDQLRNLLFPTID